jgi:outer membrane murein-binding lipoprotein Lpp
MADNMFSGWDSSVEALRNAASELEKLKNEGKTPTDTAGIFREMASRGMAGADKFAAVAPAWEAHDETAQDLSIVSGALESARGRRSPEEIQDLEQQQAALMAKMVRADEQLSVAQSNANLSKEEVENLGTYYSARKGDTAEYTEKVNTYVRSEQEVRGAHMAIDQAVAAKKTILTDSAIIKERERLLQKASDDAHAENRDLTSAERIKIQVTAKEQGEKLGAEAFQQWQLGNQEKLREVQNADRIINNLSPTRENNG